MTPCECMRERTALIAEGEHCLDDEAWRLVERRAYCEDYPQCQSENASTSHATDAGFAA